MTIFWFSGAVRRLCLAGAAVGLAGVWSAQAAGAQAAGVQAAGVQAAGVQAAGVQAAGVQAATARAVPADAQAVPAAANAQATTAAAAERARARDLGLAPGRYEPGPLNAITDVEGVLVGHVTRIEGESVRTGVTAIRPHGGNLFAEKVPGGIFVGNAFGKLAGSTQVQELGTIEAPIILTNTLNVAEGLAGGIEWTLAQPGNERVRSVNVVVGETNDGMLNDIRGRHVTIADVKAAIEGATGGKVAEGNVGAGTGTLAFGWKGGIGTASRRLPAAAGGYTLGVLVQANYGGSLSIGGREYFQFLPPGGRRGAMAGKLVPDAPDAADGSCMIVVATDAPLDGRSLERLAARAVFGLARTGSAYSNGSGDYAIAFSTARAVRVAHGQDAPAPRILLPSDALSPLFEAALEATEEAVYNALLQATDMKGAGGREVRALPIADLEAWIARQRER